MAEPVHQRKDVFDEVTPLDEIDPSPPPGRSLKVAVVTALILVALVAGFAFLGPTAFFVLVCAVVLLALFELLDALVQRGRKPNIGFGLLCGLAMLLVAFYERFAYLGVVLAVATFGALLLALRPGRSPTASSDAAWTVLGVAWIGGGGAAATALLSLQDGLTLLIAFILTAALDDIFAYFVGTRVGKHKLAPSISPGKSWEGFAGGIVGALAGGVGLISFAAGLDIVHGLAVGAICGLMAPAGDLIESLAKREIGIKDSGRLLPGHGGMLDRLDAILFCAPFVSLYLRFVAF